MKFFPQGHNIFDFVVVALSVGLGVVVVALSVGVGFMVSVWGLCCWCHLSLLDFVVVALSVCLGCMVMVMVMDMVTVRGHGLVVWG